MLNIGISFFVLTISYLIFYFAEKRIKIQRERNKIFDRQLIEEWGYYINKK